MEDLHSQFERSATRLPSAVLRRVPSSSSAAASGSIEAPTPTRIKKEKEEEDLSPSSNSSALLPMVVPSSSASVVSEETVAVPVAPIPQGDRVSSVAVLPLRLSQQNKKREKSKPVMKMPHSASESDETATATTTTENHLEATMIPLTESGFAVPRDHLVHRNGSMPKLTRAATLTKELEDKFGRAGFIVVTTKSER